MRLDYFAIHGRAISLRMAFSYCNVEFEDNYITFKDLMWHKKKGTYPSGQAPVLHLDDGTMLSQSNAILRYICTSYKGRKGETLYPGHADPKLSWDNDNVIEFITDFANNDYAFFYRTKFGSDEY